MNSIKQSWQNVVGGSSAEEPREAESRPWYQLSSSESGTKDDNDPITNCCGIKLSKTTRLYGFVICLAIGLALSLLGAILLFIGGLISFAILFSFGLVVNLIGTMFLVGPKRQLKNMTDSGRIIAAGVMLIAIAMTFMGAFLLNNPILCLVMVIVEYLAYIWYCLSYIPYARNLVKNLIPNPFK